MPMDPLFTSSANEDYDGSIRRARRKAYAKAVQFHVLTAQAGRERIEKALRFNPDQRRLIGVKRAMETSCCQYLGGPALTGFKSPRKIWQHRSSNHPEGDKSL